LSITDASPADVAAAALALEAAFAADPLIVYFFHNHPLGSAAASRQFFALLLRLRIALGMPALVLKEGERVVGAAMGYDTERPAWPEPYAGEWTRFAAETPGFSARLQVYEACSHAHEPAAPHYYLGVLGVHPALQGQGAGKALLAAFCRRSAADPLSAGVYLDTGQASSLEFYLRNGFTLRGEDDLDGTPLWCVFRADAGGTGTAPEDERRGCAHG
jgi:GNAT superfamily N-acetyltransferase